MKQGDSILIKKLKMKIPETLPVAKTTEIGHGTDSKAIVIGCNMELRN